MRLPRVDERKVEADGGLKVVAAPFRSAVDVPEHASEQFFEEHSFYLLTSYFGAFPPRFHLQYSIQANC